MEEFWKVQIIIQMWGIITFWSGIRIQFVDIQFTVYFSFLPLFIFNMDSSSILESVISSFM